MDDVYYSSFSIKALKNYKDTEFKEALKIYKINTPPEIETDVEEIEQFIKSKTNKEKREMYYFALLFNEKIIGYCQVAFLKETKIVFIDYFTLDKEFKTNITFFPLFNLILGYFNEHVDYRYFVVETGIGENEILDEDSKFLNDFLPLVGFHTIKLPYKQPLLGDNTQSAINGQIMIRAKIGPTNINRTTYHNIINDILYNHYVDWYNVIYSNDSQKKEKYKEYIDEIIKELLDFEVETIPLGKPQCSNCAYYNGETSPLKTQKRNKKRDIISTLILVFGAAVLTIGIIIFLLKNMMENFYYMFSPLIAFLACVISYIVKDKN